MERDKAETSRDIGWRVNGSPSHRQSWLAAIPTIDNFAGRLSGVGTPSAEILGSGKRTPHMFAQTSWCRSAIGGNGNEASSESSTAEDQLKNEFVQRHKQRTLEWLATGENP
ncbi:hypothetical protein [Serratia marcescens]|uniref:hypothetical protein n=1 Tax=Serratia marcescens TaxID=615 RepID=UPI003EDAE0FF